MNLWSHRFSQNMNQILYWISARYCPTLQGRNPYNFWFIFWNLLTLKKINFLNNYINFVCVFVKNNLIGQNIRKHSEFVDSKLVVGSGEQDKNGWKAINVKYDSEKLFDQEFITQFLHIQICNVQIGKNSLQSYHLLGI